MSNVRDSHHDSALEVIATMDDTVLSVRHLTAGAPSRRRSGLFAAGALGIAVFAGAMTHAASVSSQNRGALSAWQAAGNAEIDFRPLRVTPLVDAAGLFGLLAGLALITAGVWRARRERRPSAYRIGRAAGVDEGCDTVDDLTLIAATADGGWHLQPAPGMTGEIFIDGRPSALRAGAIPANSRIHAQLGPLAFIIATVAAPRAAEGGVVTVEPRSLMSVGASAFAHVVLLALFFLLPASAEGYSSEDLEGAVRVSLVQAKPQEDPLKKPDPQGDAGGDLLKTAPAPSPGVAGAKTANPDGRVKVKRTADQPQTARPSAETARNAGILGVMNARRDAFTELTATGDFSSGFDDADIHGNFRGDEFADASGDYGGHGCLPGTPCGHSPVSRAGTGDYLTNGPRGIPGGMGPGTGDPLHGRKPRPTLDIGPAQLPDGVDKNLIRRYVRQKHDELTWCYQKELTVKPTLAGTTTMAFTIDQNGRVIEAAAHGMDAPNVERCLETVVRSISFPAGNIIHVTAYPFIFHPVGQ